LKKKEGINILFFLLEFSSLIIKEVKKQWACSIQTHSAALHPKGFYSNAAKVSSANQSKERGPDYYSITGQTMDVNLTWQKSRM
jgi:hypothetical protein